MCSWPVLQKIGAHSALTRFELGSCGSQLLHVAHSLGIPHLAGQLYLVSWLEEMECDLIYHLISAILFPVTFAAGQALSRAIGQKTLMSHVHWMWNYTGSDSAETEQPIEQLQLCL